jgi:hypothetical protein
MTPFTEHRGWCASLGSGMRPKLITVAACRFAYHQRTLATEPGSFCVSASVILSHSRQLARAVLSQSRVIFQCPRIVDYPSNVSLKAARDEARTGESRRRVALALGDERRAHALRPDPQPCWDAVTAGRGLATSTHAWGWPIANLHRVPRCLVVKCAPTRSRDPFI